MTNRATLGETITLDCTIENAGHASLDLVQFGALIHGMPGSQSLNSQPVFALGAGETKTIRIQTKIPQAGLLSVSGSAQADNHQNVDARNFDAKLIFVPDPATPFEALALPGEVRTGNAPRGELIVALTTPAGVAGVDPRTFEPHWFVPFGGYIIRAVATADGRYLWITSGAAAMRVDIETRQFDLNFTATEFDATPMSIASPPGQPNVLLVSYSDYLNTQRRTVAFKDGVALPKKLDALGVFGISAEGRIFFTPWGEAGLQELALNENGLSVVTTFPTGELISPIAVIGTKVFFSFGRIFDVATGTIDDSLGNGLAVAADANAGRVWRTYSRGDRYYLESYDVARGAADWRGPAFWEARNLAVIW